MKIGDKVRRQIPLSNPALTSDQQNFTSQYSFLFQQVGWEIFKDGVEICASSASHDLMSAIFPLLWNKTIQKIRRGGTSDKLIIFLSDHYKIKTAAWTDDPKDQCYCYYIHGEKNYAVYVSGEIRISSSKNENLEDGGLE